MSIPKRFQWSEKPFVEGLFLRPVEKPFLVDPIDCTVASHCPESSQEGILGLAWPVRARVML